MPRIISLYDPSVSKIEVATRVPRTIPPGTAVIVYTMEKIPDRYHTTLASPPIAPGGGR